MTAARDNSRREAWVSYLRVSTAAQAERELSVPAQRRGVQAYAARHGKTIDREYVEPGCSGRNAHRKAFRQMLEDVLRPGSDVAVIVVYQTSRFSRDATQARVVKEKLRRRGVRVVSVCQETSDDPFGQLIEGLFECIDQYESEVNGLRTAAAMREAVRQGYFPGALPPYGFRTLPVEVLPGVVRHVLVPDEREAAVVRELVQLYVASPGAKSVARVLNQRGRAYRGGKMWSKDLVLRVLDEPALGGTYYWGKRENRTRRKQPRSEWLALSVEPIVESDALDLSRRLRREREPRQAPGRPPSPDLLLARLVKCARCGASYRLETAGKVIGGQRYTYRYYNCRRSCRIGREACIGGRVRTDALDRAVVGHIVDAICSGERCEAVQRELHATVIAHRRGREIEHLRKAVADVRRRIASQTEVLERLPPGHDGIRFERRLDQLRVQEADMLARVTALEDGAGIAPPSIEAIRVAWRSILLSRGPVARNYLLHLVDYVEVLGDEVTIVAKGERGR